MEIAIQKVLNSWSENYRFDVAENVGCPQLSKMDKIRLMDAIDYDSLTEKQKTVVDAVLESVGNGYYDVSAKHLYTTNGDNGTNSADYVSYIRNLVNPSQKWSAISQFTKLYGQTTLDVGDLVFRNENGAWRGAVYLGTLKRDVIIYKNTETRVNGWLGTIGTGVSNSLDGHKIKKGTKIYVGAGIVGQKGNIYLYYNTGDNELTASYNDWNDYQYYLHLFR